MHNVIMPTDCKTVDIVYLTQNIFSFNSEKW